MESRGAGAVIWKIDFGDRPAHKWFAWYPVRVGDSRVWLEYVIREKRNIQGYICTTYRELGWKP